MKNIRIIPRLDIKGPNLVKGIHLEGLRVLGTPSEFAEFYYENGADEIFFMDVVASLYERNSLDDIIRKSSENIFIPLTVGGGIRTPEEIKAILRAGADKVCLNSAAIKNPQLIKQASEKFGSSTIVVAVEAIKNEDGKYYAFTDNGREFSGKEVKAWTQEIQELGAGEILLTSVDKEGTGKGFNLELINEIAEGLTIPLVVHGGAGKKEDFLSVMNKTNIDGVCAASIFHYDYAQYKNQSEGSAEGNYDFLKSGRKMNNLSTINIPELKAYLFENNINIRR